MKSSLVIVVFFLILPLVSCKKEQMNPDLSIIFLHHSTGRIIWNGKPPSFLEKVAGRISDGLASKLGKNGQLPTLFEAYNSSSDKTYAIEEMVFPKDKGYGWKNYPFDYYNIWVKNAGKEPFMEEPTLEILTKDHQVIIFKHCFPVSNIRADEDATDINSEINTLQQILSQESEGKGQRWHSRIVFAVTPRCDASTRPTTTTARTAVSRSVAI